MKQTHLTLRLAQAEATEIEAEAAAAGMSVSAYVREQLRQRGNLNRLAAELRSELADQSADVVSKLKLISDQLAVLSLLVNRENKK